MVAIAMPSAGAGIGCRHQSDQGGENSVVLGAADLYCAFLQGLPQLIQNCSRELRKLIEKEHTTVGQAEFAWTGRATSPQQGGCGATVMGRSKGALLLQLIHAMEMAGDRMDACDGERFFPAQGRQQVWQVMGQAGFAAAGGTHQQEMVATCSRKGQGA
jgi:hypothetical protein